MAKLLKSWLWPGIENEVRQTLEWKSGAPSSQQPGSVPRYEDDFSNLRVQSTQLNNIVQILKFLTFDNPIKVIISDGYTLMQAIVASEAATAFRLKQHRRLTENTQGGLIQLLQFEIVLTHLGEPSEKLTLLIQDFKHVGCDGSGPLGNPLSISKKGGIQTLIDELVVFRKKEADRQRTKQADIRKQHSSLEGATDESCGGESAHGQEHFVTQNLDRKLSPKSSASMSPNEITTATQGLKRVNPRSYIEKGSRPQQSLPGPQMARSEPLSLSKKALNTNAQLVALLSSKKGSELVAPSTSKASETISPDVQSVSFRSHPASISPPQRSEVADIDSIINEAAMSAQSLLRRESKPATAIETLQRPLNRKVTTHAELKSAETAGESVTLDDGMTPSLASRGEDVRVSVCSAANGDPVELPESEDPWRGSKFITKREKTISRGQDALLARKDSWLPPEPGGRIPVSNVPVRILQSFAASVDCHRIAGDYEVQPPVKHRALQPNEVIEHATLKSENESDNGDVPHDIPFSASEWPPSSPPAMQKFSELPPDSSNETSPPMELKHSPAQHQREILRSRSQNGEPGMSSQIVKDIITVQDRNTTASPTHESASNGALIADQSFSETLSTAADEKHSVEPRIVGNPSRLETEDQTTSLPVSSPAAGRSRGTAVGLDSDASYSSQSELETAFPNPLFDQGADEHGSELQQTPPGGDVKRSSTLQVDRTPYTVSNDRSESTSDAPNLLKRKYAKQTSHESRDERQHDASMADDPGKAMVPGTFSASDTVEQCETDGTKASLRPVRRSVKMFLDDRSKFRKTTSPVPGSSSPQVHFGGFSKSLVGEVDQELPNVTQRHKRLKSITIPADEDEEPMEDPSIKARQHRREFLNKLKAASHGSAAPPSPLLSDADLRKPESAMILASTEVEYPVWCSDMSSNTHKRGREIFAHRQRRVRGLNESCSPCADRSEQCIIAPNFTACARCTSQGNSREMCDLLLVQPGRARGRAKQIVGLGTQGPYATGAHTPEEPSSPLFPSSADDRRLKPGTNEEERRKSSVCKPTPSDIVPANLDSLPLFDRFRAVYPAYNGNEKHFLSMCRKIKILEDDNRMEHRSLWDDFVVRHQKEYREYLLECADQAEDPMPYETFYCAEIDKPVYTKRILSPSNLVEAFSPSPHRQNQAQVHNTTPTPTESRKTPRSLPWKKVDFDTPTTGAKSRRANVDQAPTASAPASTRTTPLAEKYTSTQPSASTFGGRALHARAHSRGAFAAQASVSTSRPFAAGKRNVISEGGDRFGSVEAKEKYRGKRSPFAVRNEAVQAPKMKMNVLEAWSMGY